MIKAGIYWKTFWKSRQKHPVSSGYDFGRFWFFRKKSKKSGFSGFSIWKIDPHVSHQKKNIFLIFCQTFFKVLENASRWSGDGLGQIWNFRKIMIFFDFFHDFINQKPLFQLHLAQKITFLFLMKTFAKKRRVKRNFTVILTQIWVMKTIKVIDWVCVSVWLKNRLQKIGFEFCLSYKRSPRLPLLALCMWRIVYRWGFTVHWIIRKKKFIYCCSSGIQNLTKTNLPNCYSRLIKKPFDLMKRVW